MNSYGTPSIAIRAVKPISEIKIGWIAPINYEAAQVRIRVLNVNQALRSMGYKSDIADYSRIIEDNYDIVIVGKSFDEETYNKIKSLKQQRKIVYCDLCESIFEFEWVKEILSICDKVICCSYKLEELVKPINPRTMVIEDAWE